MLGGIAFNLLMNACHPQAVWHSDRRWSSGFLIILSLVVLAYAAAGTAGATLAASPVLTYDWSGDYGTVVVDSSGSGNQGTNYNSDLYSMGNGYKYRVFDSTGKYILAHSSSSLDVTAITVEAIFSTSYNGNFQTICLKRDYGGNGYWYGIDGNTGQFYFYIFNSGTLRPYLTGINVTDGKAHYITATYDGRYMNFYDFGVLKESNDWGTNLPIGISSSELYVGTPIEEHPFIGNLYLLRITNRALSASEVMTNVNNEASRVQSIPTQSQPFYDIKVKLGLNLVSLPLVNNSVWASQLGIYGIRRVSAYDNSKNSYKTYVQGFSSASDDIQIKPDQSYFMDSTIEYKIREYGSNVEPRYASISPGWNAVGWTSLTTIKASALGSRLSDIQRVCRYNTTSGTYDVYVVGFSGSDKDFDVKPGEGYFVYLSSSAPETLTLGG